MSGDLENLYKVLTREQATGYTGSSVVGSFEEFVADWCLTCKVVEKTVYTKKSIAELVKRKSVLAIKADTTIRNHPATLALKNKYNEPAVPVSILLIPGREEPVKLHGLVIGAKLEELLKGLPDKELNINGSKEEKNKG